LVRQTKRLWPLLELAAAVLLIVTLVGGFFAGDRIWPRLAGIWRDEEAGQTDVPMWMGGPERTGVMPGPGPAGQVGVRWSAQMDGMLRSSAALVDGVLYVGAGSNSAGEGRLYALDARTGEERWTSTVPVEPQSAPAVVDGRIYVGTWEKGDKGAVVALDTATGTELWRFPILLDVDSEVGPFSDLQIYRRTVASSPAVTNGVVYAAIPGNFIVALDAASGEERWRKSIPPSNSSPAVVDGVVYVGAHDRSILALDAATGEERWRRSLPQIPNTPVVADGTVYINCGNRSDGSGGWVFALDAVTGEERWHFARPDDTLSAFIAPTVAGGMVYVGTVNAPGVVGADQWVFEALDAETGVTRWQVDVVGQLNQPVIADGVVYFGTGLDRSLLAVDAATGAERWRIPLPDSDYAGFTPVVWDGLVYMGDENGYLYAIGEIDDERVAAPVPTNT
jgi:serine/threonine-protein kinase